MLSKYNLALADEKKKYTIIAKVVRRIYNKTIKINQTITRKMEESK